MKRSQASRSRIASAFTVLASLIVVVIATEVILSTTHLFGARKSWAEPDPVIGWRFAAGATYWYDEENDHPISGRINEHGWRDYERSRDKAPGTLRIAVLGDSFVEALHVELDSTFVAITERLLREQLERPVEVLNFGRSGMGQAEQRLVLEHDVAGFEPDVVVLVFMPINDIDDVGRQTSDDLLRPFYDVTEDGDLRADLSFSERRDYRLKRLVNPLKRRSTLISFGLERYNQVRAGRRRAEVAAGGAPREGIAGALSLCTAAPEPVYERNYALSQRLIADIARVWDGRMVLVCTDWVYRQDAIERWRAADPSFDPRCFEKDMEALAERIDMDYVGLQTPFENHYARNGRRLHWQHWNYEGHRLVAGVLSDHLARLIEAEQQR